MSKRGVLIAVMLLSVILLSACTPSQQPPGADGKTDSVAKFVCIDCAPGHLGGGCTYVDEDTEKVVEPEPCIAYSGRNQHQCTDELRSQVCSERARLVCGNDAREYLNPCVACHNEHVAFYIDDECGNFLGKPLPQQQQGKNNSIRQLQEKLADKVAEIVKPEGPKLTEVHFYEDFVVSDRVHVINRTKFYLHGNLVVNGTANLVVVDSELHFVQDFNMQYKVTVEDNATMDFTNVNLLTDWKWFNFYYYDNVKVKYTNVQNMDCCLPWHGMFDNTTADIRGSRLGITVSQNANITAENSSLFFELVMTNTKGRFNLPKGHVDELNLDIPNNDGGVIHLRVKDSFFHQWGVTLDHHTDVAFIDSYLTIGMNVGSDWRQSPSTVTFKGLKAKVYDDFSLHWDSNFLQLINSEVTSWYPQAWNGATLEIADSDLADLSNSGKDSTVITRNSKVAIAIARQNVVQKYYDSVIDQDVIAHDDASVYLYNTKVGGRMIENGNGKIFIDGKRLGS